MELICNGIKKLHSNQSFAYCEKEGIATKIPLLDRRGALPKGRAGWWNSPSVECCSYCAQNIFNILKYPLVFKSQHPDGMSL